MFNCELWGGVRAYKHIHCYRENVFIHSLLLLLLSTALLRSTATITLTQAKQGQTTLSLVYTEGSRRPLWLYLIYVQVSLQCSHSGLLQCLIQAKPTSLQPHPCLLCTFPTAASCCACSGPALDARGSRTRDAYALETVECSTHQTIPFLAEQVLHAAKANCPERPTETLEA